MRTSLLAVASGIVWLAACGEPVERPAPSPDDSGADAATATAPGVVADLLVSTAALAERLDDAQTVVLHAGGDRGEYDAGHIPGARFLAVSSIVVDRNGNPNELPPVSQLDSVFEALGVADGSRVVVYGAPLQAARVFFTLDYLGMGDRVALLDGGLPRWRQEGHTLSTEAPSIAAASFTPAPREEIVVDAEWVRQRIGRADVALIDARPPAQFSGAEPGDGVDRPGHVPGAANLFWEETLEATEDPRLLRPAALQVLFSASGAAAGDTVVTYCRTGMQASFAYFVARYLGYDARMYDASYLDWSRRTELPVER